MWGMQRIGHGRSTKSRGSGLTTEEGSHGSLSTKLLALPARPFFLFIPACPPFLSFHSCLHALFLLFMPACPPFIRAPSFTCLATGPAPAAGRAPLQQHGDRGGHCGRDLAHVRPGPGANLWQRVPEHARYGRVSRSTPPARCAMGTRCADAFALDGTGHRHDRRHLWRGRGRLPRHVHHHRRH